MSEPIRVAHVVGKMCGGGVEAVVMNYYRHIDRSRVQFDFLVDEDFALVPREEIGSLGGRVFVVPPYQRLLAYMGRLEGLFSDEGWSIVHSHVNALSVFPLRAAARAGVPVRIAHSHSTARASPSRTRSSACCAPRRTATRRTASRAHAMPVNGCSARRSSSKLFRTRST